MMKAWVLGDPDELTLVDKPVPQPGAAEVLVRIDAVAFCHTDIEIISKGLPARIEGGLPFGKNFTPGHEYMGTVVKLGPGVDEFAIGDRVAVEIHAGQSRRPASAWLRFRQSPQPSISQSWFGTTSSSTASAAKARARHTGPLP